MNRRGTRSRVPALARDSVLPRVILVIFVIIIRFGVAAIERLIGLPRARAGRRDAERYDAPRPRAARRPRVERWGRRSPFALGMAADDGCDEVEEP